MRGKCTKDRNHVLRVQHIAAELGLDYPVLATWIALQATELHVRPERLVEALGNLADLVGVTDLRVALERMRKALGVDLFAVIAAEREA